MKLRCRWFGCKPEYRLYDLFSYALMAAYAVQRGAGAPPCGKTVCARCGRDMKESAGK